MIAGVTGHQELGQPDAIEWVRSKIDNAIEDEGITMGFTSLAVGADQLFANVLYQRHVPYTAIIPSVDYDCTFNEYDRTCYQTLKANAVTIVNLDFPKPTEAAYMDAGKTIVQAVDLLIAVWNGKPARGFGGTADVVGYAIKLSKRILHINPISRSVAELSRK